LLKIKNDQLLKHNKYMTNDNHSFRKILKMIFYLYSVHSESSLSEKQFFQKFTVFEDDLIEFFIPQLVGFYITHCEHFQY
jgi:hypothetical protein